MPDICFLTYPDDKCLVVAGIITEISLVIGLVIIAGFGIILYRRYKSTKQANYSDQPQLLFPFYLFCYLGTIMTAFVLLVGYGLGYFYNLFVHSSYMFGLSYVLLLVVLSTSYTLLFFLSQKSAGRKASKRALVGGIIMTTFYGVLFPIGLAWNDCVYYTIILSIGFVTEIVINSVVLISPSCAPFKPRPAARILSGYILIYRSFAVVVAFLSFKGIGIAACIQSAFSIPGQMMFLAVEYYVLFKDVQYWSSLGGILTNRNKMDDDEGGTLLQAYTHVHGAVIINHVRVKLISKIGAGGSAAVYTAVLDNRMVAVKKFIFDELDIEVAREFISEASFASELRHTNIVRFLGTTIEPPNMNIVMEYCERGSLRNVLRDYKGKLTLADTLQLAIDCTKGLEYFHSKKLIHRDLKSPNYLVTITWTVKLADFGASKLRDNENIMSKYVGTPSWSAPEALNGKVCSDKSDVFSLGIVIWECLTQSIPYEDIPVIRIPMEVCELDRRPDIPSNCPDSIRRLLESCWKKEPEIRPTSSEVLQELLSVQQQLNLIPHFPDMDNY